MEDAAPDPTLVIREERVSCFFSGDFSEEVECSGGGASGEEEEDAI